MKRAGGKRFLKLAAVLMAATFLLAACGENDPGGESDGDSDNVIKFGASVSLSGALAKEGNLTADGYRFFEKYINEERGGIEVDGEMHQLEIVLLDDESDSQTAPRLVEKLITEDEVDFLLAPWGSGQTEVASTVAERYQKIMVAPLATADSLYERDFQYLFSVLPRGSRGAASIVSLATEFEPAPESIAIVYPDDLFPTFTAQGVRDAAEEAGMEVVLFESYPVGLRDVSPILNRIKSRNPDIVFNSADLEDLILMVRTMKDLRYMPPVFSGAQPVETPDFVSSLGADAEFLFGTQWWGDALNYSDQLFGDTQKFISAFEAETGNEVLADHVAAATAAEVLVLAIEEAGSLDTAAVLEALKSLETETILMPIKFGEDGTNELGAPVVLQVQDGVPQVVYPEEGKQAEPIFPVPDWDER